MEYNYFQQLYEQVQYQQSEIHKLINSLNRLNNELNELQQKPTIVIEKLEYKFDQLKVETLEGTLNIGLTPADLEDIDEVSLPLKSNRNQPNLKEQLLNRIQHYLDEDADKVIEESEVQVHKKLDAEYKQLIKTDIEKQLPARIDHYIQQLPQQSHRKQTTEIDADMIFQQITDDINRSIHAFISQFPINQDNKKE